MNKSTQNKKGIVSLTLLLVITAIIVGGIILGLFIFSEKYKWLIMGIAIAIGMFILLANAFKSSGDLSKGKISIVVILLAISIMFIFYSSVVQSFFGVSEFRSDDGKGYWLISGVADTIGDTTSFIQKLPAKGTLPDGTTVTPMKPLKLTISKGEAQCEYGLIQKSASIWTGIFTKKSVVYYEVTSPERVINAVFSDDRGNSQAIDGTISQNLVFTDSDGKGTATITTLKSTQGKQDCPSNSNIIVFKASENTWAETDYTIEYVKADEFRAFVNERDTWGSNFRFKDLKSITNVDTFTTAFSNGALTINSQNKLIGTGRDIGDVIFTVTADRDYFDSVIVTPAVPAKPTITNVDYSKSIGVAKSSNIKVSIKNSGSPGNINVKLVSSYFSFSPSSSNLLLNSETTFTTSIIASSTKQSSAPITITVCGIGQTTGGSCDTETINIDITETAPLTCGNGVCENFESFIACPVDCPENKNETTLTCNQWYQQPGVKVTTVKSWYNYIGIGTPKTVTTPVCQNASWVTLSVFGGIILILGITLIVIWKPKKINKSVRRKKF